MNSNQTPQIAPDLIWRFLDDNAVVVSPRLGEVRVLNGVGTVIWQLIADHNSTVEIESYLVAHYDVSPEQASNDLQIFLTNLTERGLLEWEA
jgi:hypothetical protein